jgi:Cdc6-like AAA superfamily ATPase
LGYLTNGEVIVVGASKLVGGVMGATPKIVNDLIDSSKGKVLVIDEAYVLARANNTYGREALDTLVERVQGTPGENFAVILCGYEEEMMTMLRDGNPGLSRRFRSEDAFKFADYNDEELISIMMDRSIAVHLNVSQELAKNVVLNVLAKQRAKPNFGNVGAINNALDVAKEKMMRRYSVNLITTYLLFIG